MTKKTTEAAKPTASEVRHESVLARISAKPTHTPGPWEVYEGGNFLMVKRTGVSGPYLDRNGGIIAAVRLPTHALGGPNRIKEVIPDARLIAAAPTMAAKIMRVCELFGANDSRWTPEQREALRELAASHDAAILRATDGK